MSGNTGHSGPFKRLVVMGESTVEGGGWLASPQERWADLLWKQLEVAQERSMFYFNAGLGASVISPRSPGYEDSVKPSAAERLDKRVIAKKPDLLVIAYGLNDMRAGMVAEAFIGEIKEIIQRIRKQLNPLIVLVNVYHMSDYQFYPPFNRGSISRTRLYNRFLRDFARDNNCVYADIWQAQAQKNHLIHPDTVHANKVGNMIIANKVFEAIVLAAPEITANVLRRDLKTSWTRECRIQQQSAVEKSHNSY